MSVTKDNDFETIDDLPEGVQMALRAAMDGAPKLTLPAEFDRFDPISDDVPVYELRDVARRARAMLKDAGPDRIRRAVEFAEFATAQPLIDFEGLDRPLTDVEAEACGGGLDELRPSALFRRRKLLGKLGIKPADLPWYVVFASLSLAYVARSVKNGVNHGIEASDALAKAELLSDKSTAAKTKPIDAHFKQLLHVFTNENPGLSGDRYARLFIERYGDEMRAKRNRQYGHRIVADWARAILKAQKDAE